MVACSDCPSVGNPWHAAVMPRVMNADNRTMERQERMLAAYRQQLVDLQEERRRSEE